MLGGEIQCTWPLHDGQQTALHEHFLLRDGPPSDAAGPQALGRTVCLAPGYSEDGTRQRCAFTVPLPGPMQLLSLTFVGTARNVEVSGRPPGVTGDWECIGTTASCGTAASGARPLPVCRLLVPGGAPCAVLQLKLIGVPPAAREVVLDSVEIRVSAARPPAPVPRAPPMGGAGIPMAGVLQMMAALQAGQALQGPPAGQTTMAAAGAVTPGPGADGEQVRPCDIAALTRPTDGGVAPGADPEPCPCGGAHTGPAADFADGPSPGAAPPQAGAGVALQMQAMVRAEVDRAVAVQMRQLREALEAYVDERVQRMEQKFDRLTATLEQALSGAADEDDAGHADG